MNLGEPLDYVHANDRNKMQTAVDRFYQAYTIGQEQISKTKFIKGILS